MKVSQNTCHGRRWQIIAIFVIFCSCVAPSKIRAQVKPVRRVLIIYELGLSSPSVSALDQQIRAALEDSPFQIELYREYLETTLFPDPKSQKEIRADYIHKYRDRTPDLVITLGPTPLRFLLDSHETSFKDVPVVFGGLSGSPVKDANLNSQFTGVWDTVEPAETLQVALRLQAGTKHVVVVGGMDAFDLELEHWFRERLHSYESKLDFIYLTDLPMAKLLERLRQLPAHTIVLLAHIGLDGAGTHFVGASQADPMIVKAANAAVYSPSDVDLGHGEVGGYLDSFVVQGKIIGEMAVRILKGERPQDIPMVRGANVYMFDWQALKHWGLNEKNLPAGSIVLNRQPTVWELYLWYIIGGIVLLLLQTLLIFGLLRQRAKRRNAETELGMTYDRLRQAVEAGKCVGWDWDAKTGCDRWFGDLQTMFGIQSDNYSGRMEDFYRRVHPEDRALVGKAVADARQNREPFIAEFRVLRLDGTVRWINARGQFYYGANGAAVRMLGMAVDITERKQAEQVLREGEERFRVVANTAPVMIWMSGTDKLRTYVNQPWLVFTGRPLEAELGEGWVESVHPKDLNRCMDPYTQAFDRRESFQTEYRLRRHDGEYRWLSDIGVPRFNPDHSFAGYIGSATDVTERKLAEESLADVGRKLIEAHEEERTWIARELHDDVNQRMALLAIELDRWNQQLPPSAVEFHDHIHHASQRISDIANDIQALSHRLHSSKLEYLGLVAAAKSFCRELSEQQKVEIDFSHTAIPRSVPKEISLCLFRVLQETLQNAVKHSGVRHFKVELCGTEREIQLTVSDLGVGFDPQDAIYRRGLGLISMRERMQLVSGEISIKSRPGGGTTIHARVPFSSSSDSARAAG